MPHKRTWIALLTIVALTPLPVRAGTNVWTNLGPDGGGASSLAIDPQRPATGYAVTRAGIFKSQDGGANWRATSPVPAGFGVALLVLDPLVSGTLYAGTNSAGIFKSTDGGASWKAVNTGLKGMEY